MTKEEIVQVISDDKMMPFIQPEQLTGIVDFVIKNYKPSLPSNLDEAAWKYFVKTYGIDNIAISEDIKRAVKFGAEWVVEQGVKLHGRILPGPRCNLYIESDCFDRGFGGMNYKFSDSNDVDLFVQIRKR